MNKKVFIVVTKEAAYNMAAESIEEVKKEFDGVCKIFQEVVDNG